MPRGKKLTAEHIQSQNMKSSDYSLEELGYVSEEERKAFLHRIGNLTILYNGDNASLGNKKYVEKKECYRTCDFIITSTIIEKETTLHKHGKDIEQCNRINRYEKQYSESEEGHWTKEMIIQRSNEIAELVYRMLTNTVEV